jgi:hypothetical protein
MARAPASDGGFAVVGTASHGGERARRTPLWVCSLISVICSLEIVKRVVTVKQVQPFRLAGPGHGYAKPMRKHRRCLRIGFRGQRSEIGDQKAGSAVQAGCSSSDL